MKLTFALVLLGTVLEGLFAYVGWRVSTSTDDVTKFVLLCVSAFAVFAVAAAFTARRPATPASLAVIVVFSILFRATRVPVQGDPYPALGAPDGHGLRALPLFSRL